MTDDPRYAETVAALRAYCDQHGYRWRWKTEPAGEQWKATVQIIDPTKSERRDRIRSWIASTGHDELLALQHAIEWTTSDSTKRLEVDAVFGLGDGKGVVAPRPGRPG